MASKDQSYALLARRADDDDDDVEPYLDDFDTSFDLPTRDYSYSQRQRWRSRLVGCTGTLVDFAKRRPLLLAFAIVLVIIAEVAISHSFKSVFDDGTQSWIANHAKTGTYAELMRYNPRDPRTLISRWNCTGEGRGKMCEIHNICIDKKNQAFVILDGAADTLPPKVNIFSMDSDQEDDQYWQPNALHVDQIHDHQVQMIPAPLMVTGAYAPYHLSHYMFNTLLPLFSTALDYWAPSSSTPRFPFWVLRASTILKEEGKTPAHDIGFFTSGKEIVMHKDEIHDANQQTTPPTVPICFKRAVVGSGNRCSLGYCSNQIPNDHYKRFRSDIFAHYLDDGLAEETFERQRSTDSHMTNCIDETIITPKTGEPATGWTVALVQRERSRLIMNLLQVFESIMSIEGVKAIKLLKFNDGCSMAATAHLLQDVDLLIGSHGNTLGDAIFMPESSASAVISVDAREYHESWFSELHTASGRRFFNFLCESDICQDPDLVAAQAVMTRHQLDWDVKNSELLASKGSPKDNGLYDLLVELQRERNKRRGQPPEQDLVDGRSIYEEYASQAARLVDLDTFIPFVNRTLHQSDSIKEWEMDGLTYPQLCERGMCCGPACSRGLSRNVFGSKSAYGQVNGSPKEWELGLD